MRFKNFLSVSKRLIITASVSLLTPACFQPVQSQTALAGLTENQIKLLKSLDRKIAVPAYIPEGFRVADVQIKSCPDDPSSCRFGPSYAIVYRGENNSCFAIEATGGGIGGPVLEYELPINSPVFGNSRLYYGRFYHEMREGNASPTIFSDWLGDVANNPSLLFVRFAGSGASQSVQNCNNISPEEAVKVTESLVFIN
ncbi:hypothetical protein ACL6C3_02885 [Capilliphycus salinus ALCB114379]|uniref:hypothetical protein n=1 Tax=Capilliphycus salinus TaxID=2768948 RepID=UPI0039A68239